jgi:hypothetical protein
MVTVRLDHEERSDSPRKDRHVIDDDENDEVVTDKDLWIQYTHSMQHIFPRSIVHGHTRHCQTQTSTNGGMDTQTL